MHTPASGAPCYVRRLNAPSPPPPRQGVRLPPDDFDPIGARVLDAVLAVQCAAHLPAFTCQDLARRFGPHANEVVTCWGIGFCPTGRWLPCILHEHGWRDLGIQAGVLTPCGDASQALARCLVIPYQRDGQICDLRGARRRRRGHTGERNRRGISQARHVADPFFNHYALDGVAPGGTIPLAGGDWKAIALALTWLPARGTRGEDELTDGQLGELIARRVDAMVLHADAEDPRPGRPVSEGCRLGLQRCGGWPPPGSQSASPSHPATRADRRPTLMRSCAPAPSAPRPSTLGHS